MIVLYQEQYNWHDEYNNDRYLCFKCAMKSTEHILTVSGEKLEDKSCAICYKSLD